jgi:hypothetical protein
MTSVLDLRADDVLNLLSDAAEAGRRGAQRLLDLALEELEQNGDISVITSLSAEPYRAQGTVRNDTAANAALDEPTKPSKGQLATPPPGGRGCLEKPNPARDPRQSAFPSPTP